MTNFQEASKRNNTWLPPPWAILALLILGFNEFMTLLRYPLYSLLGGQRLPGDIHLLTLDLSYWLILNCTHEFYFISSSFFDRNPLYLGVIFVGFLIIKALWVQLDIPGVFSNGAVSELT